MRVSFRHADFEALAQLWNDFYPARYALTAKLLEQNTVSSDLFDWGTSVIELNERLEPVGFVAVKRSAHGLFPGPNRDTAHINSIAFQDPQIGVDMMQFCKQILIQRGIDHLVFGQDIDHFFPGCPLDHGGLKDFLLIEGFDEGEPVSDLVMDLAEYSYSPKVDADIRSCTEADIAALDAFLGNAFPGRWRFDCLRKISHEGKSQFVDLLWIDGAVMGFSVTQTQECQLPIAGAVWARFHGDNWCALGPIGVSQAVRGQGFGDALLGASLARLRASGNRVCLIDWTSLTDWYGKHGFKPASTYLTFSLTLSL